MMPISTAVLAVGAVRRVDDAGRVPRSAATVVLDVLRATTTILFALRSGADAVVAVESVDEARSCRERFPGAVLAGEREGLPPVGFDVGNSPRSMTPELVGGRTVVMTTTNGTRAIVAAMSCRRLLIGALVNASAIADALRTESGPVHFLCAGADGRSGVEDELGAGAIIEALARHRRVECDESAAAMLRAWRAIGPSGCRAALAAAPAGVALRRIGLDADIDDAAQLDACPVVGALGERASAAVVSRLPR